MAYFSWVWVMMARAGQLSFEKSEAKQEKSAGKQIIFHFSLFTFHFLSYLCAAITS
jgi:hypothetical protein